MTPAAYVQGQLRRRGTGVEPDAPPGRIRFRAPAAEISGRLPSTRISVEPDGEEACVATTTGPWSRHFLVWAALLDVELEVLGPPELAAAAARVAARLAPA